MEGRFFPEIRGVGQRVRAGLRVGLADLAQVHGDEVVGVGLGLVAVVQQPARVLLCC